MGRTIAARLHLWVGLASGLVVFVVSVSGALYVFHDELEDLFRAEARFVDVPAHTSRASPSAMFAAARRSLPARAWSHLYYIDPAAPDRAALLWASDGTGYYASLIDPYRAEVLDVYAWQGGFLEDFFGTVMKLHTTLLLGKVGHWIVGVATLVFLVQLLTGLILWWPKSWRKIRPKLTLKLDGSRKRAVYDLHQVLGFYLGWLLLIVALTGLMFAFAWVREGAMSLASGGAPPTALPEWSELVAPGASLDEATRQLDALYPDLRHAHPDVDRFVVEAPRDTNAPLRIGLLHGEGEFDRTSLFFDPSRGTKLHQQAFQDLNGGEQLRSLAWDLHTGSLFGLSTKVLAFGASCVSASLPITGLLIWWPRYRKRRRLPARR